MLDTLIHIFWAVVANIVLWALLLGFIYWFLKEMWEAINLWK